MMIKPGITELSRCVDSRYTLVAMAAKRARMIGGHTVEENGNFETLKPVSIAAAEISEGKVGYVRSDSVKEAERHEAEKEAAIIQYTEANIEEALETESENIEAEENTENSEIKEEFDGFFKRRDEDDAEEVKRANAFDFLNMDEDGSASE